MAILIVERGEEEGKSYKFLERLSIGRNPEADIPLFDLKSSREHCLLFRKERLYFAQDIGSKNGTSVNGQLIQKTKLLCQGDLIRVGLTWFRFQITEGEEGDLEKSLPQYKFEEKIGKGGTGHVYKAIHLPLNRPVALKILSPNLLQENPKLRDDFIQEAATLTTLSHENICMLLDFGVADPFIYFSMELVEGLSLEDYISLHGGLEVKETMQIGIQIAKAIGHVHRQGLLHRDIKPRNIMLNREKEVKLVDFGLARPLEETSDQKDKSNKKNEILGTFEYISPEQASNLQIDERSDLYSLGITLYQMLTGSTPFEGDTPYTIIHKQIHVQPPSFNDVDVKIPRKLEKIVYKCLKKQPKDRYPNCEHLIRDLERFLKNYDEQDETMESMGKLEEMFVLFLNLLEKPKFCWGFFPFLGILVAILLQMLA